MPNTESILIRDGDVREATPRYTTRGILHHLNNLPPELVDIETQPSALETGWEEFNRMFEGRWGVSPPHPPAEGSPEYFRAQTKRSMELMKGETV